MEIMRSEGNEYRKDEELDRRRKQQQSSARTRAVLLLLICGLRAVRCQAAQAEIILEAVETTVVPIRSRKYSEGMSEHSVSASVESPERDVTPSPLPRPTPRPATPSPSRSPIEPTSRPSGKPSHKPTNLPTTAPTKKPTVKPTGSPTSRPSTRSTNHPSIKPSLRPSPLPTKKPTTRSTKRPTEEPSKASRSPVFLPWPQPALKPMDSSSEPSAPPSYLRITRTFTPTFVRGETNVNTVRPLQSTIPPSTLRPTLRSSKTKISDPRDRPPYYSPSNDDPPIWPPTTPRPTATSPLLAVTAPISFQSKLVNDGTQDVNEVLPVLAAIWRSHVRDQVRLEYGYNSFRSVQLQVLADQSVEKGSFSNSTSISRLSGSFRWLQQVVNVSESKPIPIKGTGSVDIELQRGSSSVEKLNSGVNSFMGKILTTESLQQALLDANVTARLDNSDTATSGASREQDGGKDEPRLWEIILGFSILAVSFASLVFWAHALYKKRKKHLKKRAEAAMRRNNMPPTPASRPNKKAARIGNSGESPAKVAQMQQQALSGVEQFPSFGPQGRARPRRKGKKAALDPVRARLNMGTHSDDDSSYDGGIMSDSEVSDTSFGRELQHAASVDQAAWDEFQRRKLQVEESQSIPSVERFNAYVPSGSHSESQPTTVRISRFPYGDESQSNIEAGSSSLNTSANNTTITSTGLEDSMAQASSTGVLRIIADRADRYGTQDTGDFEPYGAEQRDRREPPAGHGQDAPISLRESWYTDVEEAQSMEVIEPSQYSFMYPLKRQDVSENALVSSVADTSDDPSSAAIRTASPTVSSWMSYGGDNDATTVRSEDQSEGTGAAASMMRQVAELAKFVRKYDRKKERRENDILDQSTDTDASESTPPLPYGALCESNSKLTVRTGYSSTREMSGDDENQPPYHMPPYSLPTRQVLPSSFDSGHSSTNASDDESDTSQRLGIGRFRIRKPDNILPNLGLSNGGTVPDYGTTAGSASDAPTDEQSNSDLVSKKLSQNNQYVPKNISDENKRKAERLKKLKGIDTDLPPVSAAVAQQEAKLAANQASKRASPSSTPRSNDKNFNSIWSMFESKPKTAVTPKSEIVSTNRVSISSF